MSLLNTYSGNAGGTGSGEPVDSFYERLWNATKLGAGLTELTYDVVGKINHNSRGWYDAKGKFHKISELSKQANGKYLRGVQGKRISEATAKAFSKSLGKVAQKAGAVGTLLQVGEIASDGQLTAGEISKLAINSVASASGPWGWAYLGMDLGVAYFNNGVGITDMIGNAIDEQTRGKAIDINPF